MVTFWILIISAFFFFLVTANTWNLSLSFVCDATASGTVKSVFRMFATSVLRINANVFTASVFVHVKTRHVQALMESEYVRMFDSTTLLNYHQQPCPRA